MEGSFYVFLTFDGNCRAAIDFYNEIFKLDKEALILTTYGEMEGSEVPEKYKDWIVYAEMPFFDRTLLFSDMPDFYWPHFSKGTNAIMAVSLFDRAELQQVFQTLSEEGKVIFGLAETQAVEALGIVVDKFGVTWQLSLRPKGNGNPYR